MLVLLRPYVCVILDPWGKNKELTVPGYKEGSFITPQGLVGDKVPLDRWLRCLSENKFARKTLIIRSQGGAVETVLN